MWPFFSQVAVAEVEPEPETAENRHAQMERECAEATAALSCASAAEKTYKDAHPQHPFPVRAENSIYIQTRVDDVERKRLESEVRKSTKRFYDALKQLAMLKNPGLIL